MGWESLQDHIHHCPMWERPTFLPSRVPPASDNTSFLPIPILDVDEPGTLKKQNQTTGLHSQGVFRAEGFFTGNETLLSSQLSWQARRGGDRAKMLVQAVNDSFEVGFLTSASRLWREQTGGSASPDLSEA